MSSLQVPNIRALSTNFVTVLCRLMVMVPKFHGLINCQRLLIAEMERNRFQSSCTSTRKYNADDQLVILRIMSGADESTCNINKY
jgi:hypothetical protein